MNPGLNKALLGHVHFIGSVTLTNLCLCLNVSVFHSLRSPGVLGAALSSNGPAFSSAAAATKAATPLGSEDAGMTNLDRLIRYFINDDLSTLIAHFRYLMKAHAVWKLNEIWNLEEEAPSIPLRIRI